MKWLTLLAFCGSAWAATELKLPEPRIEVLPNGLTVVWFLNDRIPVVDLSLLFKSGNIDDPKGKSGLSEMLAAMLDRGAGGKSAQEIAHAVERLGATRVIASDSESFVVGIHGLANDAPEMLGLLHLLALKPDFAESEFTRERLRVLDRWTHLGDYGETLAGLTYQRMIAAGTPYGRGGLSDVRELKALQRADLVAFHREHFTPKNAVMMVVGRVDEAVFRAKILELFGSWTGEVPKHTHTVYADPRLPKRGQGAKVVVVDRKGLNQAQVRIGFPAPLLTDPDHYPLVVMNALLGEYFNSRLNSLIRDKLGLTYSISSSFSYNREQASFTISSATRNEAVGQLVRKTLDVLNDMKHSPVPAEEVEMAKNYLIGGFPLATATLGAVASRWVGTYLFGLGPNYLNEHVPKIRAVTPQQVLQVVARHIKPDQATVVVAGEAAEIEKSLNAAKIPLLKRLTVKDLE